MLGYSLNDFSDTFWDAAEELPGSYIIQREAKRALTGQPFFYNDGDTKKPVRCDGIKMDVFNFYFQLWDDFHFLRLLPHGKGTSDERRWVIDFIKMFEKIHISTVNYIEDKNRRREEMRQKNG